MEHMNGRTATFNCCTGCSHDCHYCYAKSMAVRYKQVTPSEWGLERIRPWDVNKKDKKYEGQVMFPSSHYITPNNLEACMTVLDNLLQAGNRVLIVSKPDLYCIKAICKKFASFKEQLLFRLRSDPGMMRYCHFGSRMHHLTTNARHHWCMLSRKGYETSVSIEPMLDSEDIDSLISDLAPLVTHSLWIGKMNHLEIFNEIKDYLFLQAVEMVKRGQTDDIIKSIYLRHKDNPLIRWKKEIKKVVGIPISERNGLDI